jgi:hypothetical protein
MAFGEKFEGKKHEKGESKKHEKKEHKPKEKLKGGEADGMPDRKFPKKELKHGMEEEKEHSKDKGVQKEIAKDHLSEDKGYYNKLDKAGLGQKGGAQEKPSKEKKENAEKENKIDDKDYYKPKKHEGSPFTKHFGGKKEDEDEDEKDKTSSGMKG